MAELHHHIVIVGGGAAGLSVAALLRKGDEPLDVAVIEPSEWHYYQPLWTLVGGGVFPREESRRREADFIPDGATWIQDKVATFEPDDNQVTLVDGRTVSYDVLVVAAGIQLDWHKIDGLEGQLGKGGIVSNYTYESAPSTWEALRNLKSGQAVFTYPNTPIKCAGAPQKIMWLAEHWLERQGLRDQVDIHYASATAGIFGVQRYAKPLARLVEERNILTHYRHNLKAVRPSSKEAVFDNLDTGEELVLNYDLLHVTPPMSAPDFIKNSPLAAESGWVDIGKHDLQHVRYPNVFALGDCGSSPNSKTAAAVRKQAPVVADNIRAFLAGQPLEGHYTGYASCPLVTGYGRLILAEFEYGGVPNETLPYDQNEERYSLYAMKAYLLPRMYWHGMLQGRW